MLPMKKVRSTKHQQVMLVHYMSTHKEFACGKFKGPMGARANLRQWDRLSSLLNEHGPTKSVKQWQVTWRDLKKKAREDVARVKQARAKTGNLTFVANISELNSKILGIIEQESCKTGVSYSATSPPPKAEEVSVELLMPTFPSPSEPDKLMSRLSPAIVLGQSSPDLQVAQSSSPPQPLYHAMHPDSPTTHPNQQRQTDISSDDEFTIVEQETHSVLKDIRNCLKKRNMGTFNRRVRSTKIQLAILVDYMSTHKEFGNGNIAIGPMGAEANLRRWERLTAQLNEHGPKKTVQQWRVTWRDLKQKARQDADRVKQARVKTSNLTPIPNISELNAKILGIIEQENSIGLGFAEESTGVSNSATSPPPTAEEVTVGLSPTLPSPSEPDILTVALSPAIVLGQSSPDSQEAQSSPPSSPLHQTMGSDSPTTHQNQQRQTGISCEDELTVAEHKSHSVFKDIRNCFKKRNMGTFDRRQSSLRQMLTTESMLKRCRLCLRPGFKSIFSDGNDNLANDIQSALQIVVAKDDGLPQYICNDCNNRLTTILQFKQLAEISQWRLTQELKLMNEEDEDSGEPLYQEQYHGEDFHDEVRQWECEKCNSNFLTLADFTTHKKQKHCLPAKKTYVCEVCGRKSKTLASFKRHSLIHMEGPGKFKCSYCDYRSKQKFVLKLHERSHTGYKPCVCQLCGKSFTTASLLYLHRRVHMPPKFHCQWCPKSFRASAGLKGHIETQHLKESRHHCKRCGNDFPSRKGLLAHERKIHNRPRLKGLGIKYEPKNEQNQEVKFHNVSAEDFTSPSPSS